MNTGAILKEDLSVSSVPNSVSLWFGSLVAKSNHGDTEWGTEDTEEALSR